MKILLLIATALLATGCATKSFDVNHKIQVQVVTSPEEQHRVQLLHRVINDTFHEHNLSLSTTEGPIIKLSINKFTELSNKSRLNYNILLLDSTETSVIAMHDAKNLPSVIGDTPAAKEKRIYKKLANTMVAILHKYRDQLVK